MSEEWRPPPDEEEEEEVNEAVCGLECSMDDIDHFRHTNT
jgi:hypothetical protein